MLGGVGASAPLTPAEARARAKRAKDLVRRTYEERADRSDGVEKFRLGRLSQRLQDEYGPVVPGDEVALAVVGAGQPSRR